MVRKWQKALLCLLVLTFVFAFPVQAKEDINTSCPAYSFTSIDGKTITNATNFGKTTLIIYTLTIYHGHEDSLVSSLANAPWIDAQDLNVLVVSIADTTKEELKEFAKANGAENSPITFCLNNTNARFDLMQAAGWDPYSFSTPLCFVIDRNGRLQRASMGENSVAALQKLLEGYVADVPPIKTAAISVAGEEKYAEAAEILRLLNIERAKEGLSALKMDPGLQKSAMLRAAECRVYYSHTRPNGQSCFTAFPAGGGSKAENIAIGYQSADAVMEGWMNSPGHRSNIMKDGFESAGIGVFYHNGIYTWVQLFSSETAASMKTPADKTVTAKVETLEEHVMLQVNPRQMLLKKGATKTVDLYFHNTQYPSQGVQPDKSSLHFQSENPAIAKVDANGLVTAVSKGTTRITVSLTGTELSATFSVTVGDHTYIESVPKEPTCAETGTGQYVCTDCGDRVTLEIPKLTTHTWNTGKVTRYPTENQTGVRTYTCTLCATTKTESIPKLGAQEQPPATQPTNPPTAAPTVPATKAPTVPSVTQPTVTTQPTVAPTPTVPTTQPATRQPTTASTQPTQMPTDPLQIATEPTELPIPVPEPTDVPTTEAPTGSEILPSEPETTQPQPVESSPEFVPQTQPTEAATQVTTQLPTQPEDAPAPDADNKLVIGIVVAVAATLAAGAFLLFWKKKK